MEAFMGFRGLEKSEGAQGATIELKKKNQRMDEPKSFTGERRSR